MSVPLVRSPVYIQLNNTLRDVVNSGAIRIGEGQLASLWHQGCSRFDVAVDEGDDKEMFQQVWRADAKKSEDTSHFGTVILETKTGK